MVVSNVVVSVFPDFYANLPMGASTEPNVGQNKVRYGKPNMSKAIGVSD